MGGTQGPQCNQGNEWANMTSPRINTDDVERGEELNQGGQIGHDISRPVILLTIL